MTNLRRAFLAVLLAGALAACGGNGGSGGGSTVDVRFENDSSVTIYYLYISPSSTSDWGNDQLGASVLSPGTSFVLRNVPCGVDYDYKSEDSSHNVLGTAFHQHFACGANLLVQIH